MQVLLENGYVVSYATVGILNDSIEIEITEDELTHFADHFLSYKYIDGKLVFDEVREEELKIESQKEQIRNDRAKTCFPIVNRGGLWYDLLTEEEKAELLDWYQAWLEAPETLVIPETPSWIK